MKTVLTSLAATAVLATSAHAGGIVQGEIHVLAQARQEAPPGQALPAGERSDGDALADIVLASPAGFTGFHGVDLSAANLAGARFQGPAAGLADDGAAAGAAYPLSAPSGTADQAGEQAEGVPEPGTLAILSMGLAGLIVSSRKRA